MTPRDDNARGPRTVTLFTAIALLAIAIVPLLPVVFARGFPTHHDLYRYEVLTSLFADAIVHGRPYPRWLPDLSGGRGYPTFVFYQPLIFYVAAATRACGASLANSTYVADAIFSLAGVVGAYRLARGWLASDRPSSCAIALLFALTPYAFTDLHVRGDQSEFVAMMLAPWPIVALRSIEQRLVADSAPRVLGVVAGGAIAWAGVVAAHPATALVYAPALGGLALARAIVFDDATTRRRWIVIASMLAALAALISSPYWFVVLQCRGFVALERATDGPFHPTHHLHVLGSLLLGRGGLPDPNAPDAGTAVPIAVGVAHAALAVAGALVAFRAGVRRAPWAIAAGAMAVVLVLAMTPLAAPLWRVASPLTLIQFPWRMLSVVAVLQAILAAYWAASLGVVARRAMLVAAIVVTLAWHAPMFVPKVLMTAATADAPARPITWAEASATLAAEVRELRGRDATYALMREFDPVGHTTPGTIRGDAPMLAGDGVTIRESPSSTRYDIAASIDAPHASAVVIRQLYFPGWRVEVNGEAVGDDALRESLLPDGQMVVAVPPGTSTLAATYDGPPGWRVRVVATWIAIAACLAWFVRVQRRWATAVTSAECRSPGTAPAP